MGLIIEDLSAGYGKTAILHDIELRVAEGCICALMGRNGSGKTTMLRCINAVIKPMKGRITAMGEVVTLLPRRKIARLISLVPQSAESALPFTCMETILMGGASRIKPWSSPSRTDIGNAGEVLSEVGISHLAERLFNQLSGGERQLVMLARALFQDTPIMLMDEPNSHLDFSNQHMMMELVRSVVKKRGTTALISLHDPNLTLAYCDYVVMVKAGRIVAHGETGEIMQEPILRDVLGENIRTDTTVTGLPVVTPRGLMQSAL